MKNSSQRHQTTIICNGTRYYYDSDTDEIRNSDTNSLLADDIIKHGKETPECGLSESDEAYPDIATGYCIDEMQLEVNDADNFELVSQIQNKINRSIVQAYYTISNHLLHQQ